jgi:hypothetical protein
MNHTNKLYSSVLVIVILYSSLGTPALAAPTEFPTANMRDFASCVVYNLSIIPEAKKFTPQEYQDLENIISQIPPNELLGNNPYVGAVLLGVKIGKFVGYDLTWLAGAVQYCWGQIPR